MNMIKCRDDLQNNVKTKYYKIFLAGLILTILASGTMSFVAWSQEKHRPMVLMGMVINTMQENDMDLEVSIHEKGNDYVLQFNGNLFQNHVMTGTLLDYDLKLIKRNNNLVYVKDKKDNLWKNSSELGLEALSGFVLTPKEILTALKPFIEHARFPEGNGQENKQILIYVSSHELEGTGFIKQFKNLKEPLSLEVSVSIADNLFFVEQLKLSFFDARNEELVLERTYFLEPMS